MHREPSASRARMEPKSMAKDAPNLQPNVQEPNAPAGNEKRAQQPTDVRDKGHGLLRLVLTLQILGWLGQTWPGLKELAHDLLLLNVQILGWFDQTWPGLKELAYVLLTFLPSCPLF